MKNVTLAIDEKLLEDARALAEERKTTLNALMRSLLAHEVEQADRIAAARKGLKVLMDRSTGRLPGDFKWNREEIYAEREDRILSRLERSDLRRRGKAR
jgi:hypothetical protein